MKCALLDGPLVGSMEVYEDFMTYKEGVYEHKAGEFMGNHAIEVVGWGTENGTEYWTCKNSWGPSWGISGYFKIKMGDSKINTYMLAANANV